MSDRSVKQILNDVQQSISSLGTELSTYSTQWAYTLHRDISQQRRSRMGFATNSSTGSNTQGLGGNARTPNIDISGAQAGERGLLVGKLTDISLDSNSAYKWMPLA